jgi:hypothetical protein
MNRLAQNRRERAARFSRGWAVLLFTNGFRFWLAVATLLIGFSAVAMGSQSKNSGWGVADFINSQLRQSETKPRYVWFGSRKGISVFGPTVDVKLPSSGHFIFELFRGERKWDSSDGLLRGDNHRDSTGIAIIRKTEVLRQFATGEAIAHMVGHFLCRSCSAIFHWNTKLPTYLSRRVNYLIYAHVGREPNESTLYRLQSLTVNFVGLNHLVQLAAIDDRYDYAYDESQRASHRNNGLYAKMQVFAGSFISGLVWFFLCFRLTYDRVWWQIPLSFLLLILSGVLVAEGVYALL